MGWVAGSCGILDNMLNAVLPWISPNQQGRWLGSWGDAMAEIISVVAFHRAACSSLTTVSVVTEVLISQKTGHDLQSFACASRRNSPSFCKLEF